MKWPLTWVKTVEKTKAELQSVRVHNSALEGQLGVAMDRISALKQQVLELERKNSDHKDALAHVGWFIAASHRMSRPAANGTIKEFLKNAQSRRS